MRIYVASKSHHAERWRAYRAAGIPIVASWIDQAGPGEIADWSVFWRECLAEASAADAFILFKEEGDVLRGAYVELGAAIAAGVPVWYVGEDEGSVTKNSAIRRAPTVDEALWRIFEALGLPDPAPKHWPFPPPRILSEHLTRSPALCSGSGKEISGLLAIAGCPDCGLTIRQIYGRPGTRINTWALPEHFPQEVQHG